MSVRTRVLAAVLSVAGIASGYPFVHYASRNAPFTPIPEKFDVSTLPNKTIRYFVAEGGPTALAPQDSFTAVLSEISLAASAWNGVASSDLRISFGGLFTPGTQQTNARIEVLFNELPPGVLAMGGPMSRGALQTAAGSSFIPITRSVLMLSPDLSQWPSATESFFSTVLHEMGHALGLQHTFTSSAMSTMVTRATTRAHALWDDDVAGLSALYPVAAYASQRGSISGQVTRAGQGAALASVVAIAPGRDAISTLSNPDGTYRIEGLASGQYYVYVHPLPPSVQTELGPGEIVLPVDAAGNAFPASDPFATVFYPGVTDFQQAVPVTVAASSDSAGVNLAVQPQPDAGLYGVSTYSYPLQFGVHPAYINKENSVRSYVVAGAYAQGLTAAGAPVPGLSVSVLGAPGVVQGIKAYPYATDYLEIDIPAASLDPGARHLLFHQNGNLYVLPSAFVVAATQPPSISAVTPAVDAAGRRVVTITGTNLRAETRFFFDGLEAARTTVPGSSDITVVPPPAPGGYTAAVIAQNPDGQSSLFAQTPPTFTYDASQPASFLVLQPWLTAGTDTVLEISGVNSGFVDGLTHLGFGTSDITVKRVQVINDSYLRAQLVVAPGAAPGRVLLRMNTGAVVTPVTTVFVLPATPAAAYLSSDVVNADPRYPGLFPGSVGVLTLSPGAPLAELVVLLNGTAVPAGVWAPDRIAFLVPKDLKPGVVLVQVGGRATPYSALLNIDPVPPVIANMWTGPVPIDTAHPVKAGDSLVILFAGDSGSYGSQTAVLRIGTSIVSAAGLTTESPWAGFFFATFPIPAGVSAGDAVSCVLTVNGNSGLPFQLPVGTTPPTP